MRTSAWSSRHQQRDMDFLFGGALERALWALVNASLRELVNA